MSNLTRRSMFRGVVVVASSMAAMAALGADIGQVKVSKGRVEIERHGATLPAPVGTRLEAADVVKTGADGSVGITMTDDSLLSAGPDSVLELSQYAYDPTTRKGRFEASLGKGTLAVVSGRIAKASPEAMTVRTPDAVLGVRGTEFVVSAK
ncbi:MAG TPA: FecR family protein [Casimicrobiaceae bacterium]|nr:FecR family protein [Casimicrobiaceae bacterium]